MKKLEISVDVLEILKKELPQCFKRGDKKLPLAVGILESVLKHFEHDERFDAKTLTKAVGLYCKGRQYISGLVEGAPRININGKAVSSVQKPEAEHALKILAERRQRKQQSEMRKKDRVQKRSAEKQED